MDVQERRHLLQIALDLGDLSPWARELLALELSGRPIAHAADIPSVHVDLSLITPSYLEFLNEQITLGARGEEWSRVLTRRRDSLSRCVWKALVRVSLNEMRPDKAYLRTCRVYITANPPEVVYSECSD